MKLWRLVVVGVMLSVVPWVAADQARQVPQEYLDQIVDEDPNPLPRYMTPEERLLPPLEMPEGILAPPPGSVRTPAEYEHAEGILHLRAHAKSGRWDELEAAVLNITGWRPTARSPKRAA